jgi:hypothetical protein
MTFALVFASHGSIWASTDRQLGDPRPYRSGPTGVKVTLLFASDGLALLVYAGIGRVWDTQVSQWVYRTLLSRKISLESSLEHICDAAGRKLRVHARRAGSGHLFLAAARVGGRPCLYTMDIMRPTSPLGCEQPRTRTQVISRSCGTGAHYAETFERTRITKISRLIRRYDTGKISAFIVARELATLNTRVSERARSASPPDTSISSECVVCCRNFAGGGSYLAFDANGQIDRLEPNPKLPIVAFGEPISGMAEEWISEMQRRLQSLPPDATPEQRDAIAPDADYYRSLPERVIRKPDDEFH